MNTQTEIAKTPVSLGIEAGGTRCVAIAADQAGRCIHRIENAEPTNLRLLGDFQLKQLLNKIAGQVPEPAAIGISMAGIIDDSERARVRTAATEVWPGVPCWVGNDLEAALAVAGNGNGRPQPVRVIVISGVGASCYGRGLAGQQVLTGRWEHLLGDRGSGYDIAFHALDVVFREFDRTGRWPMLGQRLLAALHLNSPNEAVSWVGTADKSEIAALALVVFKCAADGDKAARQILSEAAQATALTATACGRRLVRAGQPIEFILMGSILLKQPRFAHEVKRRLLASWPDASVKTLSREAAWGAVALAQQQLRMTDRFRGAWTRTREGRKTRFARHAVPKGSPAKDSLLPPAGIQDKAVKDVIPVPAGLSPTEQRNPKSKRLDKMSLHAAVRLMLREESSVPKALLREEKKITAIVRLIVQSFRRGGRLFYVGAGTSGRLGLLDAHECPPTFGIPSDQVQAILAGGDQALRGSFEGAEDNARAGAQAMRFRGVSRKDVVVGISASGRTPFVWGALDAARERGAKTILVCFNPNLRFHRKNRPTLILAARTGPEVLTGSTRLKAGTATKILLNTFSTLAMVRMGKVVENLMVDVQASNEKLRERAIRIVQELAGTTRDAAWAALRRHAWSAQSALAGLKRTRMSRETKRQSASIGGNTP